MPRLVVREREQSRLVGASLPRVAPRDSGDGDGFATAKGLLRDFCQQQPGAPNSSSQAREYAQDQDVKASVDSEDAEKTGDQEQDRSDGVGCDRVEDRRDGVRGGAVCICVDSGASIQNQKASSVMTASAMSSIPITRYDWSGMEMRIVMNSTATNSASVSAAPLRSS